MDSHILNKNAFSLIEIALCVSVMGSILVALLPLGGQIVNRVNDVKTDNDLNVVAQACQQYYASLGHWPSQVSDLQPIFLSSGINGNSYILNPQSNILIISSGPNSITTVRPRGSIGRLDYNFKAY